MTLEAVAQDVQTALVLRIEGRTEVVEEYLFGFRPEEARKICPLVGLGLLNEGNE